MLALKAASPSIAVEPSTATRAPERGCPRAASCTCCPARLGWSRSGDVRLAEYAVVLAHSAGNVCKVKTRCKNLESPQRWSAVRWPAHSAGNVCKKQLRDGGWPRG